MLASTRHCTIGVLRERTCLNYLPKGHWAVQDGFNSKKFLDRFMQDRGLDPHNACNWYTISNKDILEAGGSSIMNHFSNSIIKLIAKVYPTVHLDARQFTRAPTGTWEGIVNRRNFFDQMAADLQFCPDISGNWYKTSSRAILSQKGGASVLASYRGSYIKAIIDLYPELTLDHVHFYGYRYHHATDSWFYTRQARRYFFDAFACHYKFDPLSSCEWYTIVTGHLKLRKGGKQILDFYSGSFIKGLQDVYPDLLVEIQMFHPNDIAKYNHSTFTVAEQ